MYSLTTESSVIQKQQKKKPMLQNVEFYINNFIPKSSAN